MPPSLRHFGHLFVVVGRASLNGMTRDFDKNWEKQEPTRFWDSSNVDHDDTPLRREPDRPSFGKVLLALFILLMLYLLLG